MVFKFHLSPNFPDGISGQVSIAPTKLKTSIGDTGSYLETVQKMKSEYELC